MKLGAYAGNEITAQLKNGPAAVVSTMNRMLQSMAAETQTSMRQLATEMFSAAAGVDAEAFRAAGVSSLGDVIVPNGALQVFLDNSYRYSQVAFNDAGNQLEALVNRWVSGDIDDSSFRSRVRLVFRRLVRTRLNLIASTEIGGAYSEGYHLAMQKFSKKVPNLKKRWLTTGNVKRRGHQQVEDRTRRRPIPVDEYFKVRDYSYTGVTDFMTVGLPGDRRFIHTAPYRRKGDVREDLMMYPRDLNAASSNRINCKCIAVTVVDSFYGLADE